MSIYNLQIKHGGVLVVDLQTDDAEEAQNAIEGFEYELAEMITGRDDE